MNFLHLAHILGGRRTSLATDPDSSVLSGVKPIGKSKNAGESGGIAGRQPLDASAISEKESIEAKWTGAMGIAGRRHTDRHVTRLGSEYV